MNKINKIYIYTIMIYVHVELSKNNIIKSPVQAVI